jgi:hypothetical protein
MIVQAWFMECMDVSFLRGINPGNKATLMVAEEYDKPSNYPFCRYPKPFIVFGWFDVSLVWIIPLELIDKNQAASRWIRLQILRLVYCVLKPIDLI